MRRILKTEGIVFKKNNLFNKDKIITLFTYDFGLLRIFAKGVKKITSRRLPHLETGNLIKVEVYQKGDRFYLQESALISGFYKIKSDPGKYKYLYLFLFILNKVLPEQQQDQSVFKYTKLFLSALSRENQLFQPKFDDFLSHLLYNLGYTKQLERSDKLYSIVEEIIDEKLPLLNYN